MTCMIIIIMHDNTAHIGVNLQVKFRLLLAGFAWKIQRQKGNYINCTVGYPVTK